MNAIPLIRVVDDNEDIRRSLEFMLRSEGYQVALFESASAFLKGDTPSRPGCLILDVMMPGLSGLELFNVLKSRGYEMPIIFLTAHADVDMAVHAMREGACDFHQKPIRPETFLPAVARALARCRRETPTSDTADVIRRWKSLTEREEEIARHVANGLVNRTIGERLSISPRTVEHYRASAVSKLGIKSAADLAAFFETVERWREAHPEEVIVPQNL